MPRLTPQHHMAAVIVACLVVFGLHPQRTINLQPMLPKDTAAHLVDYTPYYPGQKELYRHEIFAPQNQHKKRLVILGSSTADS
ncbi:MAG: hypothetical protein JO253_05485, partial [Alphaproteobacteria bacterium]|nr:hypothetical protein [Alphaproteobacteria bacterium]